MEKEKRDIRIVFLVFSMVLAIFAWKYYPSIFSYGLICLAAVILSLASFSPLILRPAFKIWLKVARAVGWFNTQLLLTILFILVFIPTGLVMRLFGKDPMKRKRQYDGTYWEFQELWGHKDKNSYKNQF